MDEQWEVYLTAGVDQWLHELAKTDVTTYTLVNQAIWVLSCSGPTEGRPLVDRVKGATLHNLKELRPGSAGCTEVRILFMFDPWRSSILLVAGDKSGDWQGWYRSAIPAAEQLYAVYLEERKKEMGQ